MAKARLVHREYDGEEFNPLNHLEDDDDPDDSLLDLIPARKGTTEKERTMATKKVSKEAPKEEVKSEEKKAKPENNNVKLADVAKEFGLTGRQLRIHLRSKGYERSEGRWEWDPKSADLAKLRKELAAKKGEKKEDKKAEK